MDLAVFVDCMLELLGRLSEEIGLFEELEGLFVVVEELGKGGRYLCLEEDFEGGEILCWGACAKTHFEMEYRLRIISVQRTRKEYA